MHHAVYKVLYVTCGLEGAKVIGHAERRIRLLLDLVNRRVAGDLHQSQAAVHTVDVEDGNVGDDSAYATSTRQGQLTLLQDLALAVLVGMVCNNDDLGLVGI